MTSRQHPIAPVRPKGTPLPRPIQEHLGRQLRAVYRETEPSPAYLGDPGLPSAFDDHLHRLADREAGGERARIRGLGAVRAALQDLLFAAQLAKH
jgi:hypothetical protein